MPGKLQMNTSPNSMGFSITADDTALIGNNAASAQVSAILAQYQTLKLCDFNTQPADPASWTNGGTKYIVTCPNKQIAKGISIALQLLDNTEVFV